MGARNHDPATGRFMNIDPLAEDYLHQSPYAMAANNPIYYVDVNGEGAYNEYLVFIKDGEIQNVQYTGDKGGDETDYITEVNLDLPLVQEGAVNEYELDVDVEYTAGIGNNSEKSQTENPTPGSREVHGKDTFLAAIDYGVTLFTGGESKAVTMSLKLAAKKQAARVASAKLRKAWEKNKNKLWPKEPKYLPDGRKNPYYGRNQSVSHKKALKDGGGNSVGNIEPKPWKLHQEMHKRQGDFKRWAQKRKKL